jgi:hypothetical protein
LYAAKYRDLSSFGVCKKHISPPAAAKYALVGGVFCLILRSKIRQKTPPTKYNLAISAEQSF